MKHRIIECQEQFQDFDKFVSAIGLPKLMNATESSLRNEINDRYPENAFKLFQLNKDKDIKLFYSIVPYGAGGSFLGVLQDVARGKLSVKGADPENRKVNLWDDQFGLNFKETPTFNISHLNETAQLEDVVIQLINRETTWSEVWGKYITFLSRFTSTHELQYHINLLTLPFFVETECLFLLDMDLETFVWTHFLSHLKHAVNGQKGSVSVASYVSGDIKIIHPILQQIERCNNEWDVFCLFKNFELKPKLTINYTDLIVKQEYNAVKQYLEATKDADTSNEMIATIQGLLKKYHNENLKIMNNWDKVKHKVLKSYKWSRTYG